VKAEGKHYGIFLVRQENSIAGVGTWLIVNGEKQESSKTFLLFIPTTLELAILLFLLRKL
jgi:hypothetical protein